MVRYVALLSLLVVGCSGSEEAVVEVLPKPSTSVADGPGLSRWIGKDLRELADPEKEAFQTAFAKLTGQKLSMDVEFGNVRPWWLSDFRNGATRWILFEGYKGMDIPDVSWARVHRFGEGWKYLGSSDFPTGYRMFLTEAKPVTISLLKTDAISIRTHCAGPFFVREDGTKTPAFEQGQWQRQLYVLLEDRPALIRLDDDEQNLVPNSYRWSVPMKGPQIPKRTAEQWEESLNSDDPRVILEALVWLSGAHLPSNDERYPDVNQETVEDSKLFEKVVSSPAVKRRLSELAKSKNPWVREAAKAASTQEKFKY